MKEVFKKGDIKIHKFTVGQGDLATFDTGSVHKVCSTFKLGKEIEWSSRLFVLEMCDSDEEGVGTYLEIKHRGPAFLGEEVEVIAEYASFISNQLICDIRVSAAGREVAKGRTGQKILSKHKIKEIFNSLEG